MSAVEQSISTHALQSAIRRTLHNDTIVVKTVVTMIPPLSGDHYLSEVEYCDVEIDEDGATKHVNLFVKKEINEEKLVKGMPKNAFDREILVYDVLLRDIVEYCRENETTHIDVDFFPLCFYTGIRGNGEKLIAMENLATAGYTMPADMVLCQNLDHAILVVKAMATLHSVSYVMNKKSGVDFVSKYNLTGVINEATTPIQSMVSNAIKATINILKNTPNNSQLATKLEKYELHAWARHAQYYRCADEGNLSVLCHGDSWNNNMLFLYGANNEPVKVKLVDWQITHCGVIGKDLCHYLNMSVKPEIRRRHLPEILRTYYDQFCIATQSLGADDILFSYDEFVKEYSAGKLFGLNAGLMVLTMAPITEALQKEKAEDSEKEFDISYFTDNVKNLDMAALLTEENRNNIVELVKECEEEMDALLLKV